MLYHRREQLRKGEIPTTYQYKLSEKFRLQIQIILERYYSDYIFAGSGMYSHLLEEFPEMSKGYNYPPADTKDSFYRVIQFFFKSSDDMALSIIEVMCACFNEAMAPINDRFEYERVGYQYNRDAQQIIKIEDETYYNECTVRALSILSQGGYENALAHYLDAYEKLSKKDFDEALTNIGRAMESLLKTRFDAAGIQYSPKDNLAALLTKAGEHINLPTEVKFEPLKQVILNAGRARNLGGHGHSEGSSPEIDDTFVRFAINQCAANLLYMAEADFRK